MKPRWSPSVLQAILVAASLAIHVWLILAFPIIFGGDSMARLMNRDRVLLSHQLPMLQLGLYWLSRISPEVIWVRLFMSGISALAVVGFYRLATNFASPVAAFWAALLFATNPFITPVSTVPYQEILMLAGLLFAFDFFCREQWLAAGMCLGLACLSRFEAWVACPVMAFGYLQQRGFKASRFLQAGLLFGWAPLGWLAFQRGLAPSGSYVIDRSISLLRLQRVVYIAEMTAKDTPIPVLLLACLGAIWMVQRRSWRERHVQLAAAFFLLFLVALLFSAHGDPPDPNRYITSREAHIPITLVTLLSALALMNLTRLRLALCGLGVLLGVYGSYAYVRHETSRPEIRLGYELARYLDQNAEASDRVLILAKPIDPAAIQMYLDKVRETGGEAAVADARKILANAETSPLDFQRTFIHSRLGRNRLKPYPEVPAQAEWIAVWSDFEPTDARAADLVRLAASHPTAILRWGDRSVTICRPANPVVM